MRLIFAPKLRHCPLISIHAPLTGCDFSPFSRSGTFSWNFNPRTPHGVRLAIVELDDGRVVISIHAPLTGCDGQEDAIAILQTISIHAPLTGCDEYNIL